MKINGVVFDLDHTLFDRYKTLDIVIPKIYKQFKSIISESFDEKSFTDLAKEADAKKIHYGWDAVFDYYEMKNALKPNVKFPRQEYLSAILDSYRTCAVKYDFTKPLLEDLRKMNLKTGLITNGSGELQRSKLKMLEIENCFDSILISGEFGVDKPDKRLFEHMAENLKEKPEKLLFVGDHPVNDAQASQAAGYIPVLVMTMGFDTMPEASNFKYRIPNVSKLKELILNNFN